MRTLSQIRGVGANRLKALEEAGIRSVRELLLTLPVRYKDLTAPSPIGALSPGMFAAIQVRVDGEPTHVRKGKLLIARAIVTDGEDALQVVWYNQPWLQKRLRRGTELLLYGRVERFRGTLQMTCPTIESGRGLLPVYEAPARIPPRTFALMIEDALEDCAECFPENLPDGVRSVYALSDRAEAIAVSHRPQNAEALSKARRRLGFEELLLYQVALGLFHNRAETGIPLDFSDAHIDAFAARLPFSLTGAQMRTLREIADDMRRDRAMARMVQGDVGSGKTAVAFGAIALCCGCGYQAALMAPTEVLAQQHYASAKALLEPMGFTVGLLTGSLSAKKHRLAHEAIAGGAWDVVIGTHALITEKVEFARLALTITDEQHRFGVRQRTALSDKGIHSHVLVMSATPIPRSLALILYGDLDISVIDELPPGRKPVATRIVTPGKREGLYGFLRDEVHKGRQVYIVCPLVEESEAVDALPAEQVYEDLRTKHLSDLRISLVHGKMRAADKEEVLETFRRGESDVLVSTTVIEVGVNVPNATIMVIENAERFGLAQLHQLRGRVGRGNYESWCFLMSEPNERLRYLSQTHDGFKIAQKDMELRGSGEMFGTRQSGAIAEGLEAYISDAALLKQTHDLAREVMKSADDANAQQIIESAKARFADRLKQIAVN